MKNKFLILLMVGLGFMSCSESLDVPNENQPDFLKVYASGDDVLNVAKGLYNTYYNADKSYYGMQMFLATAADNASCSWGNQAMRDMSWEPRKAWTNTPGYSYAGTTKYTFDKMYAVINTASLVLKAMDNGLQIGKDGVDDNKVRAFARFNMGLAYGTLAMNFDKAFIVDEEISIENATVEDASPYSEIMEKALYYLDDAISISANTFTIPSDWMGTPADLSNSDLKQLANSMAARILANTPRNKAQMASVDWNRVLNYANAGISADYVVVNDGYDMWYAMAGDYLTYPGWGVVDTYVVNKLDPTLPAHWDDDPAFPAPPESTNPNADDRINTDFEYLPSNWLRPDRGYYHWSNYRYSRYDDIYALGVGSMPELLKSENDLYKAEAMAWNGNVSGAADIINAGTRTSRGKLPNVADNLDDVIDAIHHERVVEMVVTGTGLQFYSMRKYDLLQYGTPLHLPLPAKTLETFGVEQPFYTFGGPDGADGINGSNGGWR